MNTLRVLADAFDQPAIEQEKLDKIVAHLKSFEVTTIKSGPGYYRDTGTYNVRLSDHSVAYNEKDPRFHPELTMSETELYAVQAYFAKQGTAEAGPIGQKLDEAARRIEEAKDYVAEMLARPPVEAPRRRMF